MSSNSLTLAPAPRSEAAEQVRKGFKLDTWVTE